MLSRGAETIRRAEGDCLQLCRYVLSNKETLLGVSAAAAAAAAATGDAVSPVPPLRLSPFGCKYVHACDRKCLSKQTVSLEHVDKQQQR